MANLQPGPGGSNPTPRPSKISLVRQTERHWTLSDGEGAITANAEAFVEVRQ